MPKTVQRLSWEQALTWRMQRHHLVERAQPRGLLGVVSDICGLHAQVASSAELRVEKHWHRAAPSMTAMDIKRPGLVRRTEVLNDG